LEAPAVVEVGKPVRTNLLAAPAATFVLAVAVILEVTVSLTVRDRSPTVPKVTLKLPVPLLSVEVGGSTARPSVLVKRTTPV
jgi:hypothetical protein